MCKAAVDSAIMHDSEGCVLVIVKLPFIKKVDQLKEIQLINRKKYNWKTGRNPVKSMEEKYG